MTDWLFAWCRGHELKALWEWLGASKRKLQVIGMLGPLANDASHSIDLNPTEDRGWMNQSVAFVIME